MKPAPIPEDEGPRLRELAECAILDTPPEVGFDKLTKLVAQVLNVPISLVSLVAEDRQWFKASHGLAASETPRDVSFCGHAVFDKTTLVVPNALEDPRFADNPLVQGPPFVRFYAGAPLVSAAGHGLGTLCAIDHKPRQLSDSELAFLELLAQHATELLASRRYVVARELSEARLRAVIDSAIDAIITIDELGTVEQANPAVQRLLGYAPAELIGSNVRVIVPAPDKERHDAYLANHARTGHRGIIGIGREVMAERKDGSTFFADLTISEFEVQGRRRYTGVLRDISERKRIEQLQTEFISNVSHELRTPLTVIRCALGLVVGGVLGEIPGEAQEHLSTALSSCGRLVTLVNDLLDIGKLSSEKMRLNLSLMDLAGVVKDEIAAQELFAASQRIELRMLPEPATGEVLADRERLGQVLVNLLSNAAKFSPAGETVAVSVERRAGVLRVCVRDRGPGVGEQLKDRLFQRFVQGDGSSTRAQGGTGLGLAISKAIVSLLGGVIGFENIASGGANFYFDLPRFATLTEQLDEHAQRARNALVCAADAETASAFARELAAAGVGVLVAPTLARARALIGRVRFEFVCLEASLPDGCASELLEDLKSGARHSPPSVLVVGAVDREQWLAELNPCGSPVTFLGNDAAGADWGAVARSLTACSPPHGGSGRGAYASGSS